MSLYEVLITFGQFQLRLPIFFLYYPVENSINFQILISKIISKFGPKLFPNYFQTTTTDFQKNISKSNPKRPPNFPHFNNKSMPWKSYVTLCNILTHVFWAYEEICSFPKKKTHIA